ncbi:MAG: hypothetical protein ACF8R9_04820 [Phycisphaerales bacterium JB054]
MMKQMKTRVLGLVMAAGLVATPAIATPPALDRVSPDTPIIIGIKSLSEFSGDTQKWAQAVLPPEAGMQVMMMNQMLSLPGLNPDGSAAVSLSFPNGMQAEPVPTLILPMADYGAFVEAMQGNAADGVAALNMMGNTMYAKNLGDGFMAMSPEMGSVESFSGKTGQTKAHKARMGARGTAAADGADVFVVLDIESMRPMLEGGLEEMKGQMEMAAMMGGEAAAAQIQTMTSVLDSVVADGRTAVVGLGLDDSGVWLDFAGQFAEGSDTGKIFADSGNSTPLLGAVPNMPYVMAMAFDLSNPGIQGLMAQAAEMNKGMGFSVSTGEMMKHAKGQAMVMGTTPGLFAGGLFSNTVQFTASDNPEALLAAMKTSMTEMNGQSNEGMIFKTSFAENAGEAGGKKLCSWSLAMEADPNHENAMAASMALSQMTMLFGGQTGPSGYATTTDKGMFSTFSKNSKLMEQVLAGGDSMANNDMLKNAAAHLPADRTAEFYLNIKGVLDMVGPMMAMFAPGTDLGQLPEQMNPIALGLATGGSGMHARIYLPGDVLEFAGSMAQKFGGEGDWEDVDDEPNARPRF